MNHGSDKHEIARVLARVEREIARQNAELRAVLHEAGAPRELFQRALEFQPVKRKAPAQWLGAVRA